MANESDFVIEPIYPTHKDELYARMIEESRRWLEEAMTALTLPKEILDDTVSAGTTKD